VWLMLQSPSILASFLQQYASINPTICPCSHSHILWDCRDSTTMLEGNNTRMSAVITLWVSLTKWPTITFVMNGSDGLPWLPKVFISSQQWMYISMQQSAQSFRQARTHRQANRFIHLPTFLFRHLHLAFSLSAQLLAAPWQHHAHCFMTRKGQVMYTTLGMEMLSSLSHKFMLLIPTAIHVLLKLNRKDSSLAFKMKRKAIHTYVFRLRSWASSRMMTEYCWNL
jgi:hypothetical protein